MMTKTSNTKKALLSSAFALLVCVAMLIGTTFAWFTDTASTGVNKIQAGNLDIALEMKNSYGEWVNAEGKTLSFLQKKTDGTLAQNADILWEPGCTYELPELRVLNKGNLAVKYMIKITGIQGNAKLNEVIDWTMTVNGAPAESLESVIDRTLPVSGAGDIITVSGHMQENAGNEYQGLSIDGIGITVYATQAAEEFDSLGNTYDEHAQYGETVTTSEEFTAALSDGKTVILANDISLSSELRINKNVTVYGNGHSMFTGAPVKVGANNSVTFKNVCFAAPSNSANNASNLYASGLKGTLVLDGCTFSSTQWDCVQVTPAEGASIIINGCRFETDTPAQRFIHIEADYASNANVKVTLTNNFFGSTAKLTNSMIDLDYINIDGIDFGGNNVYTDTSIGEYGIFVCGSSADATITSEEAFRRLGAKKAANDEVITGAKGNVKIPASGTATINGTTSISAGVTISGDGKDSGILKSNKAKIASDNVTIKDITVKGSGSVDTAGTLNINGNNTTLENVDYKGDGNIAITVSTGKNNSGTVFKKTKITNAFRGIQFWSLSGDSLIDECVLDVAGYTFNIDAAVAGSTLTIRNSTLNGWTSYTSGIKLVSFEDCKLGLNAYEFLRPYSETKLTNCEFTSAGYALNAGGTGTYTITLTNCTKNGTAITPENVKSLLLDTNGWNGNATLIVNGIVVTL